MKKVILTIVFTLAILVGLMAAFSTAASADNDQGNSNWGNNWGNTGAVFTMTNAAPNAVIMFSRDSHGELNEVGSFPTLGNGGTRSGPPDTLMSQGSVMLSQDGKWLLAVNAGSSTVSVFQVKSNGLTLTDQEGSGGTFPVSLTISGNEVFVLNAASPNISGFKLSNTGKLTAISGSTTTLPSPSTYKYTQVGFDNSGKWLAVSDLGDNSILTSRVNSSGIPGAWKSSSSSGPAPFAFIFDARNDLLSVQAGNSAVSSYSVLSDGTLSPIIEAFNPTSNPACWIVEDQSNDVFTTNPGTANISSYQDLDNSGNVGWLTASAASGISTIDEGITNDGDFLYALGVNAAVNSAGNVYGFKISGDGSLKMVGTFSAPGLTNYSQGLAAW